MRNIHLELPNSLSDDFKKRFTKILKFSDGILRFLTKQLVPGRGSFSLCNSCNLKAWMDAIGCFETERSRKYSNI